MEEQLSRDGAYRRNRTGLSRNDDGSGEPVLGSAHAGEDRPECGGDPNDCHQEKINDERLSEGAVIFGGAEGECREGWSADEQRQPRDNCPPKQSPAGWVVSAPGDDR